MRKKRGENEKHGDTGTPLYNKWRQMRVRCLYPSVPDYKYYGGRGIQICERWDSYINFREDMGESFIVGLTLDREDPDGDYCPENCRWATPLTQQRNKRKHRKFCGQLLVDYCRDLGLNYEMVFYYLNKAELLDKS